MDCPRCTTPLQPLKVRRDLTIDWCPDCAGTWYDRGELEAALGVDGDFSPAAEGRAPRPGIRCPRCGTACTEVVWPADGTVSIDHCGSCGGNWLDKGELQAVHRVIEERSLPAADNVAVAVAPDGTVIRVLVAPLRRRIAWGWVATGAIVMVILFGAVLGFARFNELFSAFADRPIDEFGGREIWLASLPAFLLGGIVVGRGSPGFTIKEAALAALPATIVVAVLAQGRLGLPAIGALVVVGMILALVGGIIGERLQAS